MKLTFLGATETVTTPPASAYLSLMDIDRRLGWFNIDVERVSGTDVRQAQRKPCK